jgi:hypothetical protein
MGVLKDNSAFRDELDQLMERRRDDIQKLLKEYGVPLVAAP